MNVPQASEPEGLRAICLDGTTAVVAAMAEELQPLATRGRIRRKLNLDRCRVQVGTLGRAEVVLAQTGEGRRLAERGLQAVLDAFPIRRVVVVGVAGGLSPGLAPGLVVIGRTVHGAPEPDANLCRSASRDPRTREGVVVSSETILCTAESKARAWAAIDRSTPAVVDLESAAYAEVAARAGCPFVVLRAVCDPAEETLPVDLNACRDESGSVSRLEVFQRVLVQPSLVKRLLDLRRRVALGADNLATVVDTLLNRRLA